MRQETMTHPAMRVSAPEHQASLFAAHLRAEDNMGPIGRIALRVAVPFAVAASLWALILDRLTANWPSLVGRYDYLLDLAFAVATGTLLYFILSRELLARAAAQHEAVAQALRRANDELETRVRLRTEELQAANGALRTEIEERARAEQELTLLLDLSCQVASTLDRQRLLDLILEHVQRMIDCDNASIWQYEGDRLAPLAYRGTLSGDQAPGEAADAAAELPADQEARQQRQPVVIGDLQDDSAGAPAYRAAAGQRLGSAGPVSHSWMSVPLIIEDRVIGMLHLDHETQDHFSPRQARLAMAIANQAAIAIQNAISHEDAQRLAVLNERARLARDLHDSIIQAVYGMMWNVRNARSLLSSDAGRAAGLLDATHSTARTCLIDLRSMIFELRPELLEQHGLAGLLARHIESMQSGHLIELVAEIGAEPELPLKAKEGLYRIAQEALQNALKHSQAQQISLRLVQDLSEVFLEVKDDGVGFDPGAPSPGQLGLVSMQERAAQFGGNLEIQSGYGRGTQVRIRVPRPAQQAAARCAPGMAPC